MKIFNSLTIEKKENDLRYMVLDVPYNNIIKMSKEDYEKTIKFALKAYSEFRDHRTGGTIIRKPLQIFFNIVYGICGEKIIHKYIRKYHLENNCKWFVCDSNDDIYMHKGNFDSTDLVIKSYDKKILKKINISVKTIKSNAGFSLYTYQDYNKYSNNYYIPNVTFNKQHPYQENEKPEYFDFHFIARISFNKDNQKYPIADLTKVDFFKEYLTKDELNENDWEIIINELLQYYVESDEIKYLNHNDFKNVLKSKNIIQKGSKFYFKDRYLFSLDASNYYIFYNDYNSINNDFDSQVNDLLNQ